MIRKRNNLLDDLSSTRPGRATLGLWLAVLGLSLFSLAALVKAQGTNANTNGPVQGLQAAADLGDAKAQYDLGNYYEKAGSDWKATEFWRKSAEQGYAPAQAALGSAYGRGAGEPVDITNAVAWYQKSAAQGYAAAEYMLGNFYAEGTVVTNDLAQAVQWWTKSATQNYANAEAVLGEFYVFPRNEYGTNYLNYTEGFRWLRRAAAHGSVAAMNNLGLAYESATGVGRNEHEYIRWYREAAERGEATAQSSLGQCYLEARGVPRDPVEAYKWIKLSAMHGCFLGRKYMSYFSDAPLKPKELAEAEQRVLDFRPKTDTNYPVELELQLDVVTNSPTAKP